MTSVELPSLLQVLAVLLVLLEILGLILAVDVVYTGRTPQGTVAWAVSLILLPMLAVPLYLVFGPRRLYGYVRARRRGSEAINRLGKTCADALNACSPPLDDRSALEVSGRTLLLPPTTANRVGLLINGRPTFRAIFDAIDHATDYVLVQFYILRHDKIGRELESRLLAARARGVRIYVLYDGIGSGSLKHLVRSLKGSGCFVQAFGSSVISRNRFQLNFRNHRKTVIVDGRRAFVGGLNVGDEYLGASADLSPWRDTHVEIEGPAVQAVQLAFCEDWNWAADELPKLEWEPRAASGQAPGQAHNVLVVASGPADDFETMTLTLLGMISGARRRVWIASPYFAPPSTILNALQLAALRGVDVRILISKKSDNALVNAAMATYMEDLLPAGIEVRRYRTGFMHQKVILADEVACVGTANVDNRSLRINFELSILVHHLRFAEEVRLMLERDMAEATSVTPQLMAKRRWYRVFASRLARLFAPVL